MDDDYHTGKFRNPKTEKLHKKTIKIYGPPGTGKTYTLIERILKKHLRNGIRPEKLRLFLLQTKL
jgi:superfamily I DNA/RNA helicase